MPPVDPTPPASPAPDGPPPVWGKSFSGDDPARNYRVRSEETWTAAREDYECGWTAEEICRRYDIGLSAFRHRARREEWRKCDHRELEPEPFRAEPEAALSTAELVDLAWRSVSDAMRRGRVYEARAWMKLAAELKARQRDEDRAARQSEMRAEAPDAPDLARTSLGAIDAAMRAVIATAKLGKTHFDAGFDADEDEDGEDGGEEEDDASDNAASSHAGAPSLPLSPGRVPGADSSGHKPADGGHAPAQPAKTGDKGARNTSGGDGAGSELHRLHSDVGVQSASVKPTGSAAAKHRQPQEPETGEPDQRRDP